MQDLMNDMQYKLMQQQNLLELVQAKQNTELQEIKKRFSEFSKYFFNLKRNITIVYDSSMVYIIHKEYLKIMDLGKTYIVTDIAYNYDKNVLLFMTIEGALVVYFASAKFTVQIKKEYKRVFIIDWIYNSSQTAHIFVAEEGGIHLYKFDQERKSFKEVKHISGKYHCFLYEPIGQLLVGFPYGDCESANLFQFQPPKAKNWYKAGEMEITFEKDELLFERIRKTKSFGLESSRVGKQIFGKKVINEDYFIDCLRICNYSYICFYMASEGKLKLTPIDEHGTRKPVTIKLPSDSLPIFNIIDNMLAVHLKNQKITFIYDIGANGFQTLVSPYPLKHENAAMTPKIYNGQFVGRRVLLGEGEGVVCKWKINLGVIFHFLKNEMTVFEFLNNRSNSKMEIIRWLRNNIFVIKPINLSKIWKLIFIKNQKGIHDESDMVTIVELYSNLFYTLSIDPLISKQALTNVLIECIRQSYEYHVKLPDQLQYLCAELLLQTKKYEMLTYLCHHDVIKADPKLYKLIFAESEKSGQQLLLTLSADLASQSNSPKELLRFLLKTRRLKEGKRFLKSNTDKFQVLDMMEGAKYIVSVQERREFIRFVRMLITQKFPSMNTMYLDEAEKKLFD